MVADTVSEMERLNRKFRPPLMAFFSRRVTSLAEAEDMTQEVFLRLMKVQVTSEETIAAYVFKIAANLIRDRQRGRHVRDNFVNALAADPHMEIDILDPFRIAAARETIGLLWASIQILPEPTRQIFILYSVENIQSQAIADSFGLHLRTVERHISKALVLLSRKIEWQP